MRFRRILLSLLCATAVASCGGGGGVNNASSSPANTQSPASPLPIVRTTTSYFPLDSSNRWLYEVITPQEASKVQVDVGSTSTADGTAWTEVVTSALDGTYLDTDRYTVSVDGLTMANSSSAFGVAVGPYKLMKFPITVGETFVQINKTVNAGIDLDGDGINEQVDLLSTVTTQEAASITTPAGVFTDSVRQLTQVSQVINYSATRQRATVMVVADEWYAPEVGLVRRDVRSGPPGQLINRSTTVLQSFRTKRGHAGPSPMVTTVGPSDDVTRNGSVTVTANFSLPMDATSLNNGGFSVVNSDGTIVAGTVLTSNDGSSATFIPTGGWHSGQFTASVNTLAVDRQGNAATPRAWSFRLDVVTPTLAQSTPPDGATGVATDIGLTYTFNEPLSAYSVNRLNEQGVRVTDDTTGESVRGSLTFDGSATFRFAPYKYLQHGHSYSAIFSGDIADLNGNPIGSDLKVRFQTAQSLLTEPTPISTNMGYQPFVTVGDINGDGLPDIIWTSWDMPPATVQVRLYIRYGRPDGQMGPVVEPIPTPTHLCSVMSIAIGDINRDGKPDLVMGSCGIQVFTQQADGSFSLGATYPLPGYDYAASVKLADINKDGLLDIISCGNSGYFKVWLQTRTGAFELAKTVDSGLGAVNFIDIADLNGDGYPDVLANGLNVIYGKPNGDFAEPVALMALPQQVWGASTAIADLNGDGLLDIVTATSSMDKGALYVMHQGPDHVFTVAWSRTIDKYGYGVALLDTDGDGKLDIAMGHEDSLAISLQRGDGSFAPEDIYGSLNPGLGQSGLVVSPRNATGKSFITFQGNIYKPLGKTTSPSSAKNIANAMRLLDRPSLTQPSRIR